MHLAKSNYALQQLASFAGTKLRYEGDVVSWKTTSSGILQRKKKWVMCLLRKSIKECYLWYNSFTLLLQKNTSPSIFLKSSFVSEKHFAIGLETNDDFRFGLMAKCFSVAKAPNSQMQLTPKRTGTSLAAAAKSSKGSKLTNDLKFAKII